MNLKQDLKDITLITATSINIDLAKNALIVSNEHCHFGAIKILSPSKPNNLPKFIEHVPIPEIDFLGYSKFMIEDLYKHVQTSHCLIIQADGFIINPNCWSNQFLDFDYIGAPWPATVQSNGPGGCFKFDKNRVGNGGFSLRSKNLLDICSRFKFSDFMVPINLENSTTYDYYYGEDVVICHFLYQRLINEGIKFAPLDIASKFSIESVLADGSMDLSTSFGFHGKNWLSSPYLREIAKKSNYKNEYLSLLNTHAALQATHTNKVRRLDPCPCGNGKRFKDCHGKIL